MHQMKFPEPQTVECFTKEVLFFKDLTLFSIVLSICNYPHSIFPHSILVPRPIKSGGIICLCSYCTDSDAHSTTSSISPSQSPTYSNQSDEESDTETQKALSLQPVFSFLDLTYWKR